MSSLNRLENQDVDLALFLGANEIIAETLFVREWSVDDRGDVPEHEYTGERTPRFYEREKGFTGRFTAHVRRPIARLITQFIADRRSNLSDQEAAMSVTAHFANGEVQTFYARRVFFEGPQVSGSGHDLVELSVTWFAEGGYYEE